jgi:hypothetical protein
MAITPGTGGTFSGNTVPVSVNAGETVVLFFAAGTAARTVTGPGTDTWQTLGLSSAGTGISPQMSVLQATAASSGNITISGANIAIGTYQIYSGVGQITDFQNPSVQVNTGTTVTIPSGSTFFTTTVANSVAVACCVWNNAIAVSGSSGTLRQSNSFASTAIALADQSFAVPGSYQVTITTLGSAGNQVQGVVLTPAPQIITPSLPNATQNQTYNEAIVVQYGVPPFQTSISSGSLPAGLSLNGQVISGTPTTLGTSNFTFAVTDANNQTASQNYSIIVEAEVAWTYPISANAPANGSVLALDSTGANIVAAPAMPLLIGMGQFDLSTVVANVAANTTASGTIPGAGIVTQSTDLVGVSPGQGWSTTTINGLVLQGSYSGPSIFVSNVTSAAIAIPAGSMIDWIVLR